MMVKIQIKSIFGKILFELEKENNSIKETIQEANLKGADLEGAYLEGANLKGVNLKGASLEGAELRGAYLEGANLKGANLKGVNLKGVNLKGASLEGASLEGVNLKGAYLKGASLEGADLEGAELRGAYLEGAGLYQIVGIGSKGRCTTYDSINHKVICGCFYGSLEEFEEEVKKTHEINKYAKQYLAWTEMLRKTVIKKKYLKP
jgi:hypothetical protein